MDLTSIAITAGLGLLVICAIMGVCQYAVLAERKISAWIQGRVGPNRATFPLIAWIPFVGKIARRWGLIQPMADGGKFLFKEDVTPAHVNKVYFILAPIIAFVPGLVTVCVVPFGQFVDAAGEVKTLILANVDVGLLFIFAFSSLGVYAIVLSGWASNSKYPFLGGIRASAQLISYELAMGLAVIPVFLWTNAPGRAHGTLSLVDIVNAQQGLWFCFSQPVSCIVFLIALFAETNRLPFDMPESETDLVGGYHTEYSSFKFGFFFVGEYANMIVGSAVVALVFLGGWHPFPGFSWGELAGHSGWSWLKTGVPGALFAFGAFFAKTLAVLFFFIWVRWTVPRFRYDQVMRIGWRKLLPVAIGNLVVYAIAITLWDLYVRK